MERQRLAKEWEQEQEAKMLLMMPVSFVFYEGKGSTNHYEARARSFASLRMSCLLLSSFVSCRRAR